ncbi:1-deoxy-D-xylulose-5-phosphate reductoisomerase [Parachlamydia sp. AcF125]|uniref:1-deoxy-D-xylulose-5-phosphate reductoisomerase n=1 Tax=Parachlamydia sp. AcF125 TaxID=2795736 RepID=UPI001BCA5C8C|nr:1-deoxy-D-xylulose-5-phosphate reductoisomerase [Parachlamydia sp. AcF125]MBS4169121.1 1-deoxy-D-xylulose 5-phosphate reductoisomerase [Parachlamydia sp. AcF125]
MKKIALLGSTGSIGTTTLQVVRHLKDSFQVTALAAHSNIDRLEQQAKEFLPELIAVYDENKAAELQKRIPQIPVLAGMEGLNAVACHSDTQLVISAISGTIGLIPTISAIKAGKDIALANKEVLVSGGSLVMSLIQEKGCQLLPVDSEHSAIFQCLNGEKSSTIHRLILTASGGPFRDWDYDRLKQIQVEEALNHPNFSMGAKITIDSSTLMNKGLEVIEAYWLFGVKLEQIEVLVHPQQIVHSMVEFTDGAIMAQMGEPSMIVPIQYAMTYPNRVASILNPLDLKKMQHLEFSAPNYDHFPCLRLAFEALRQGGSLACYMNAANEVLVHRFLQGQFGWIEIAQKLENLMLTHASQALHTLEDILQIDAEARRHAERA